MSNYSTGFDTCLCCGQNVGTPRQTPVSLEEAETIYRWLLSFGYTRQELLTKRRAQVQYQIPGFLPWLEKRTDA